LNRLRFLDLLDGLQSDLYDRRTGRGWIILYNPVQIASSSGISFLALGSSWSESLRRARVDLPIRLRQIVTRRGDWASLGAGRNSASADRLHGMAGLRSGIF